MIELRNLSKQYGTAFAVRDLNVRFERGKVTALLGPSGCGKTTTLRMINRLSEPTSGTVLLDGQDTRDLRPEELRRRVGYVIQQVGLFPHLSVARNVATVPELLGWERGRVRERVDELLTLVGLEPRLFRDKRPSQLSGGQAQRVGVARALAADPEVVLMDEPFGALDPLARERLQGEFLGIQRALGKTVVLVTHDIDEALRMGDHIALMHEGRLAQYGTPDELLLSPESAFVGRFFGEDARLLRLSGRTVRELMHAGGDVEAGWPEVEVDATARSALTVMLTRGEPQVRVTEEGRTVGRLTLGDLGRA